MNANQRRRALIKREDYETNKIQREKRLLASIDNDPNTLTSEEIEEFFKATEDGSIERLERLFNERRNADVNMTRFNESLLMAAIRRQRTEVAEYLIDQLAIDVNYAPDLHEFRMRTKAPIRERTYTCRDLAYEKGMMELVDLIDLVNGEVTPNIKRYLKKRLQSRLDDIHDTYLQRSNEQSKLEGTSQIPEENTARETPTAIIDDDDRIEPSPTLAFVQRPFKSRIDETAQTIDTTDKSIDETGKKTFHFNNYNLRFRLTDKKDLKKIPRERWQSPTKTSVPVLPPLGFPLSPSPPLIMSNNNRRSFSEISTHFSNRDSCLSLHHSIRSHNISQLGLLENKPLTSSTPKNIGPKRFYPNNVEYRYVPQHDTSYSSPRRMPVTLKATAIGLPSDTRIIRD